MASPEILPIREADFPAIAQYIYDFERTVLAGDFGTEFTPTKSAAENLAFLRWALLDNPVKYSEFGMLIRSPEGQLIGFCPYCPFHFRFQDRRLLALASIDWFADRSARIQFVYLVKRLLELPGVDFCFSNSSNEQSGPLWEKCGGRPLFGSDVDWLVPLRLGPLVREAFLRRGLIKLAGPAGVAARLGNWWVRARNTGGVRMRTQPTDDRKLIADLAERYRNRDAIVSDRNLDYLHWAYLAIQAVETRQLYHVVDPLGRDGWFSVSKRFWGLDRRIRMAILLDWAVPPSGFEFADLVRAAARAVSDECDVLAFRLRTDAPGLPRLPFLKKYKYANPKGYLVPPKNDPIGLVEKFQMNRADAV